MMPSDIEKAAELLKRGELVVIPTETVYGLAANCFDENAVRKIFELKQRPMNNPLIVHIASMDQLYELAAEVPQEAVSLAAHFWPGPLTFVLPKKPHIPDVITAGGDTLAVRMPAHPMALELLQMLDFPLAAPSANPSNYLSPTSAEDVKQAFAERAPFILDGGRCEKGIESTVVGFSHGEIVLYRYGAITKEKIEEVVQKPLLLHNKEEQQPQSPGMLGKHYSPKAKLKLVHDLSEALAQERAAHIAVLAFQSYQDIYSQVKAFEVLSPTGDLEEAAYNFFNALYRLDQSNPDIIYTEFLPEEGLGMALNDRLHRAAK